MLPLLQKSLDTWKNPLFIRKILPTLTRDLFMLLFVAREIISTLDMSHPVEVGAHYSVYWVAEYEYLHSSHLLSPEPSILTHHKTLGSTYQKVKMYFLWSCLTFSYPLFQRSCSYFSQRSHYALVGLAHLLGSTSVIKFKTMSCALLSLLLVSAGL